jgi:hypothetical protein
MRRRTLILLLLAVGLSTSCSTFTRRWRAAADKSRSAAGITGRWDGNWQSTVNQHRGGLRCILSQTGPETFEARFRATFWKILRSSYTVELVGTPQEDGSFALRGESDLGWLGGGLFRCEAHVDPTVFEARYHSERDEGTFDMRRPAGE